MIIRSSYITREDIGKAVANVDGVSFQDTRSRDGWFVPIREFNPRDGGNGFEFFLSGSSPYRAQHDRDEFAATWTEWGLVIAALYKVDPNAQIGQYNDVSDFENQTATAGWKTEAEKPWLAVV